MTVLVLLQHIAELLRRAVCHGGCSRVGRPSPCCSKHQMRRYCKYAQQLLAVAAYQSQKELHPVWS